MIQQSLLSANLLFLKSELPIYLCTYIKSTSSKITINFTNTFIKSLINSKATINDAKEIMDLINEAYNNNGSEKWINRDLCPRISCLEQVKDMIPNAYITRHDASEEITGVVVAKLNDDDVVYIGPFATRPKFQVLLYGK